MVQRCLHLQRGYTVGMFDSQQIPNESSDYDTTSLTDHQEQSVHVSLTLLWYKQSVSTFRNSSRGKHACFRA